MALPRACQPVHEQRPLSSDRHLSPDSCQLAGTGSIHPLQPLADVEVRDLMCTQLVHAGGAPSLQHWPGAEEREHLLLTPAWCMRRGMEADVRLLLESHLKLSLFSSHR